MKRFWLLGFVLLLAACGKPQAVVTPPEVNELPPAFLREGREIKAVATLSPEQARQLRIQTRRVTLDTVHFWISLPGEVMPAPTHQYTLSAPIEGIVSAIYAHEGEQVREGEPLLELESLPFAQMVATYLEQRAEMTYREKQVARLEKLVAQRISPERELERARADLERARTLFQAAYTALKALGVSDAQIRAWESGANARPNLRFYTPMEGIITRHQVEMGKAVSAYQELLTLIRPGRILVRGYLDPADARYVQPGVRVVLRDMRSNKSLETRVATINPSLDEKNRSLVLNILTQAADDWPVIGQQVHVDVEGRSPEPAVALPLKAIVYDGPQPVVFVRLDSLHYEERPVRLRKISSHAALIESGLRDGEEVAISQVYTLKALVRYATYAEE